ncbi:MAG: hypothetical protein GY856_18030 [bacterium]|nr:hypothetical protein [bacterium]
MDIARRTVFVAGILVFLAASSLLAQAAGTLSGVVVATRADAEDRRSLLTAVRPGTGEPVDRVEIRLPKACSKEAAAALARVRVSSQAFDPLEEHIRDLRQGELAVTEETLKKRAAEELKAWAGEASPPRLQRCGQGDQDE